MQIGPKRDIVGDLANSIRKRTKLTFGLYHSLFEWFNPLYLSDVSSGYKNQDFVKVIFALYRCIQTVRIFTRRNLC
jgi:alpha-L-fucosidase